MTCASASDIARPDVAAHRHAAESPSASDGASLRKLLVGARAAGAAVGDQADAVAARDLLARKIEHVAEQAADRGAEHVQNIQGAMHRPGRLRDRAAAMRAARFKWLRAPRRLRCGSIRNCAIRRRDG